MSYHLTPVRLAILKKTRGKCLWGCGENGTFVHCSWECKLVRPLWQTVWKFLKKLKTELPYDPAIPHLGIYSKEMKTGYQKDIFAPMFIASLFTIAKVWKQPKCLSMDEWIKKMWYIHTMKYYSAMRKKEILPFVTTWKDLEGIMLSDISQRKTNTIWYHYIWNLKQRNKQTKS